MKRLIAVIVTFSLPVAAWAETQPLEGAKVRVTTSDTRETLVGKVAGFRQGALELTDVKKGSEVTSARSIPVDTLATLEISRGTDGRSGLLSLVGFGIGAAFGLAACAGDQCSGNDAGPTTSAQAALSFGALGSGVGALVGIGVRHEVWEPLPKESFRVAIAPARGRGIAVALSVGF